MSEIFNAMILVFQNIFFEFFFFFKHKVNLIPLAQTGHCSRFLRKFETIYCAES